MGWMPGSFLLFVCLLFVVCCFAQQGKKNEVMDILLQPKENIGYNRETNGGANPVDKELYRRASKFLLINRLKTIFRSVSILSRRVGYRI